MGTLRKIITACFSTTVFIIISVGMTGCGAGQLPGPTFTPASTDTPIATATNTALPTNTPEPSKTFTPTPRPFVIKDEKFAPSEFKHHLGNEGAWVKFTDGGMEMHAMDIPNSGLRDAIFANGVRHEYVGVTELFGYTFTGEAGNPLEFRVTSDGYTYIGGKGTVKMLDGSVENLP
jgi:hypothetical protein